jgi:membrane protease YdiL (CAAX protease family)
MDSLKQSATNFLFSYDPDERDRGDDLGIVLYGFFIFYFGAIMVLTQDTNVENAMYFYLPFDLCCILFFVLHRRNSPSKQVRLPTKMMWIKSLPIILIMLLLLYIISYSFYLAFPAQMYAGNVADVQYLLFGYLRIVPIEEVAFRGLGIEIFLLFEPRDKAFMKKGKKTASELINENKYFIAGMIASSILFGTLHFRAYPGQVAPLIYLIILGFMLAFLRFKYGLFASMFLHALNNAFASGMIVAMLFAFIH